MGYMGRNIDFDMPFFAIFVFITDCFFLIGNLLFTHFFSVVSILSIVFLTMFVQNMAIWWLLRNKFGQLIDASFRPIFST